MRKVIVFSAVAICSTVGAGFASGRELAVFFGKSSSPLLASVFLFFLFFFCFFVLLPPRVFRQKLRKAKFSALRKHFIFQTVFSRCA